jgi:hypothetical protein
MFKVNGGLNQKSLLTPAIYDKVVPMLNLAPHHENTGKLKKKVTLSHVYNEQTTVSLQSRDTQQLGKLSQFVCN